MDLPLAVSRAIDALNRRVGHAVYWLILAMVLVSAGNAVSRYLFDISSNAWLELQWYLFAAVFLLGRRLYAAAQRACPDRRDHSAICNRARAPGSTCSAPFSFCCRWRSSSWSCRGRSLPNPIPDNEYSSDAGGLLRWPVKLLIPVGFLLLALQGVSEIIKRVAFLLGYYSRSARKAPEPVAEEQLSGSLP